MKTYEEKLEEMKCKHKREIEKGKLALSIFERLPTRPGVDVETDWRVFVYPLHGRVATATRKTGGYDVEYRGALAWSIDDLAICLEALPPLPTAHLRYTFTTFSQLPLCEKLQKELDKSPSSKLTELSIPVFVELDPGKTATFKWFTEMAGIGVVEVHYPIPWQRKWMTHDWRRIDYLGGFVGGFRYEGNGSGLILFGMYGSAVNWSRGSPAYMGSTTLYWANQFTLSDLIKALREAVLQGPIPQGPKNQLQ